MDYNELFLRPVNTHQHNFLNMPENNPVRSRRDQHLERLRTKYPEKKFEDDEEIFGQISDDYDAFEAENQAYKEHERAFSEMFHSNPRSARLMMEWKDGKDPVAALVRIYGKEEILAAIEDPSRLEAIEEANREFAARLAKNDEYEAQYEKNFPESCRAVDEWASENGISEDVINQAGAKLAEISANFIVGKFTPEIFDILIKAANYDTEMNRAREEGEVAGRNAKIVEKMRNSKKGDGITNLNGRNGTPSQKANKQQSVFDLAREAD